MLPDEQSENSRYFYELASARFGFSWDKVMKTQAFHFKGGQGAKTGTGGHLPGPKVVGKIAEVRGLSEGQAAISPARFPDWTELSQYRDFAAKVAREAAAFRWVSNYPLNTSRKTSMRRWTLVSITLFSMAAAAAPEQHR